MTVISRTIRSIPYRSASDTWKAIIDLLAPSFGAARTELESVTGTACSVVSEECMNSFPLVVSGSGPRIRIYCIYNDEALEGEKASESALSFVATQGSWKMSLPTPEVDLDWVQKALKPKTTRITARKQDDGIDEEDTAESNTSSLTVNMGALKNL